MPTPPKNVVNMTKNLTPAMRAARIAAQEELTREKTRLVAPAYIKKDLAAMRYWKTTLRRMRGITLLDDLDSEMLAVYCQILSRRDALSEVWRGCVMVARAQDDPVTQLALTTKLDDTLKRLEAQERLALSYAERLGLTPSGRVRLAKKRAEERSVDPNDELYGDGE